MMKNKRIRFSFFGVFFLYLLFSPLSFGSHGDPIHHDEASLTRKKPLTFYEKIQNVLNTEEKTHAIWVLMDNGIFKRFFTSRKRLLDITSRDEHGRVIFKYPHALHPVSSVQGIHFKSGFFNHSINPDFEYASYSFQKLLIGGEYMPQTTLMVIENPKNLFSNPDKNLESLCIQASETVMGSNFQTWLKEETKKNKDISNSLQEIDASSYSALFLNALLTSTHDGKEDNFIIQETGDNGKRKLFSIDNDYAFVCPYYLANEEESDPSNSNLKIYFKNILCFFPSLMKQRVPLSIKNRLKNDEDLLLFQWLFCCLKKKRSYETLRQRNILSQTHYSKIGLEFKFGIWMIDDIRKNFKFIKTLVHQGDSLEKILRLSHPLIYEHYQQLLLKNKTAVKARKALYDGLHYTLDRRLNPWKILQNGKTITETLKEEKNKIRDEISHPLEAILKNFPLDKTRLFKKIVEEGGSPEDLRFFFRTPENPWFYFKSWSTLNDLRCYGSENAIPPLEGEEIQIPFKKPGAHTYKPLSLFVKNSFLRALYFWKSKETFWNRSPVSQHRFWGYEGQTFWLKANPTRPALEQKISKFIYKLFGRGSLRTTLTKINGKPYLYIQKPPEKTFQFFKPSSYSSYEENKSIFEKVDPQSLSEIMLLSIIFKPVPWTLEDFLLERQQTLKGETSYTLTAAYNDFPRVPMHQKIQDSQEQTSTHPSILDYLNTISVPLHPLTIQRFLSFFKSPSKEESIDTTFFPLWRKEILKINQKNTALFTPEDIERLSKQGITLTFPYNESYINQLSSHVEHLYNILENFSGPLTYKDLTNFFQESSGLKKIVPGDPRLNTHLASSLHSVPLKNKKSISTFYTQGLVHKNAQEKNFVLKISNKGATDLLVRDLIQDDRLASLEIINLKNNFIGNAGAFILASHLPRLPLLMALDLSLNAIKKDGAQCLYEAFLKHPALKNLNLDGNVLSQKFIHTLSDTNIEKTLPDALRKRTPKYLNKLGLSFHMILFLEDLILNPHREVSVSLSKAIMSQKDQKALEVFFQERKKEKRQGSLKEIDLSDNGIVLSQKVPWLKNLFCSEKSLKKIYCQNNFSHFMDFSFLNLLKPLHFLESLNLSGTLIKIDLLKELFGLLKQKFFFKHLGLADNHLNDAHAPLIGNFIEGNKTLEDLNLSWNQLSKKGFTIINDHLLAHLSHGKPGAKTLKTLLINGNQGSPDDESIIHETLINHTIERALQTSSSRALHPLKSLVSSKILMWLKSYFKPDYDQSLMIHSLTNNSMIALRKIFSLANIKDLKFSYTRKLNDATLFFLFQDLDKKFYANIRRVLFRNCSIENAYDASHNLFPFSDFLGKLSNIEKVSFPGNGIKGDGFCEILKALEDKKNLRALDFSENPMGDKDLEEVKDFVKTKQEILKIFFFPRDAHQNAVHDIKVFLTRNQLLNKARRFSSESHEKILIEKLREQEAQLGEILENKNFFDSVQTLTVKEAVNKFFNGKHYTFLRTYNLSNTVYKAIEKYPVFIALALQKKREEYPVHGQGHPKKEHVKKGLLRNFHAFSDQNRWTWEKSKDFTHMMRSCHLCSRKIRFGHLIVFHGQKTPLSYWVGSLCAYYATKSSDINFLEGSLKRNALRRAKYLDASTVWKVTPEGYFQLRLRIDPMVYSITCFKDIPWSLQEYRYTFDGITSKKSFKTLEKAKKHALKKIFPKTFLASECPDFFG